MARSALIYGPFKVKPAQFFYRSFIHAPTIKDFNLYCVFNCSLGQVWKIFIPLQVSRVYDSRKQHNSLHMLEAAGLSKWRIISKSLKKAPKCNTWYKIWAFYNKRHGQISNTQKEKGKPSL